MNTTLEKYLNTIDKHLRPLPLSERVDIVKEIKASILEMQNENLPTDKIIERLGNPKDLAKAYLGDLISTGKGFGLTRFLSLCAFYSIVGFSGIVIIPTLAIIAPTFIGCGILSLIAAAVKIIDNIFKFGIPFIDNIGVHIQGIEQVNPFVEFCCLVGTGIACYFVGKLSWKLLIGYIKKVSKTKKNLSA